MRKVLIQDLRPHPLNYTIYGNEEVDMELVESIKISGILTPITIKPDNTIISGHRRFAAAKEAGLTELDCHEISYIDPLDERAAIIEFNKQRVKTVSQKYKEAEQIEDIERERAKNRKAIGGEGGFKDTPELAHVKGETREKVAEAIGMKRSTYEAGKKVYEAAKEGNEKAVELLEKLDSGEISINKAAGDLRREERIEEIKQEIESKSKIVMSGADLLPELVLADPPWRYEFSETKSREIENQYPTASLEEIEKHKPKTAKDCILLLWTTTAKLEESFRILNSWGFTYKSSAVWDKEILGMGYWFRGQHEFLLVGVKGKPKTPLQEHRISSVFREKRSKHSKKPECVYMWIEKAFPHLAKLEMYCRFPREGWSVWGNQAA